MRYFNTEGCCKPNEHYMVCLDDRLRTIREEFVEKGKYFISTEEDSTARQRHLWHWRSI